MTEDSNLAKLSEYLENSLAKRLLDAYKKEPSVTSVKSVLEGELNAKTEVGVIDDNADED
jgi:hypothetical protein